MNTHEHIRTLLPLASSGSLGREEMLAVEQHVRTCEECRHELNGWGSYTAGLKRLPQPAIPAYLVARTQARILREREASGEIKSRTFLFAGLSLLSWAFNFLMWKLVQELTGGRFDVLGVNLVSAGPWFLVSFVVCGTSAIAVAVSMKEFSGDRRTL